MVLMLCYVSYTVCSQVYLISVENRMLTSRELRVRDGLAISILVLTLLLLVVWWIVNAYYQNSIVMLTTMTLVGELSAILSSLVVIALLSYCRILLKRA